MYAVRKHNPYVVRIYCFGWMRDASTVDDRWSSDRDKKTSFYLCILPKRLHLQSIARRVPFREWPYKICIWNFTLFFNILSCTYLWRTLRLDLLSSYKTWIYRTKLPKLFYTCRMSHYYCHLRCYAKHIAFMRFNGRYSKRYWLQCQSFQVSCLCWVQRP